MKKLMFVLAASAAMLSFAEENKEAVPEAEKQSAPIVWGFGNYGIYSGYQLYGSLLNPEPTLQGYFECNVNLPFAIGPFDDLGYFGAGIWSNTDLTGRRSSSYRRAFNENDPNVHYDKTFWFDDNKTWGLEWRTYFVWYYYPHTRRPYTATTVDWDNSFALLNPYVIPFLDVIYEFHENDAMLYQFGLKRTFEVCDDLTVTPQVVGVIRDHRYNWCFATDGFQEFHNGGWATMRFQLDANYQITSWLGVFAKVAFCTTVDGSLRDASDHSSRADYGKYKDFVWGGCGLSINF